MSRAKKSEIAEIEIPLLKRHSAKLRIIGTTPLFQNRMSNKVKQGFLTGTRKKTKVEKLEIKHRPLEEYRNSAEILQEGPTALGLRVVAIKKAMCTAALETVGLTRSSTQKYLFMPDDRIPLYGTPQLRMDVVRSADINRTPDIRTRAFLPQWGAEVEIKYIVPQLSIRSVVTLLCNAGVLIGVGDGRQEKGTFSFGSFRVIGEGEKDAEWNDLVKNHGRKVQERALDFPKYADGDTAELMEFFEAQTLPRVA